MAFQAEFRAVKETNFYSNALVFATEEEAKIYGKDLFNRWFVAEEWRVVETDNPVTYALEQDESQPHAYHLVSVRDK